MVRYVLTVAVLLTSSLLTSCSFTVGFFIVNESIDAIEVKYDIAGHSDYRGDSAPSKVPLYKWKAGVDLFGESWAPTNCDADYLRSDGSCKIKLAKGEVLKILETTDAFESSGEMFSEIRSLQIKGRNGTISYEGKKVFRQFEEENYSARVITYR